MNLATSTTKSDQASTAHDDEYWSQRLLDDGYCILRGALPDWKMRRLYGDLEDRFQNTPFCIGDFYGYKTKRFGSLLRRSQHAQALVMHDLIVKMAERVLLPYCDNIQLNLTQAVEVHSGQDTQVPHRDQDMWRGAPGACEYLVNVMWPLVPYSAQNGATLVWPGSHTSFNDEDIDLEAAVPAEMVPGDALIFLGSTLHGAGANHTNAPRTGVIISYCLGWLKPYENQWLAYPPEVASEFSPELAALVGYRQHRPNLGNYEGQCPSVLLKGETDEHLGAIDELLPEQAEQLAEYNLARGVHTNAA